MYFGRARYVDPGQNLPVRLILKVSNFDHHSGIWESMLAAYRLASGIFSVTAQASSTLARISIPCFEPSLKNVVVVKST